MAIFAWLYVPLVLAELAFDQGREGGHRLGGLAARTGELDRAADARRQHHQAHDRQARDLLALEVDADHRVELAGAAHELGGRPRMQAALVGDRQGALDRADGRIRGPAHEASLASMREATVMYLRPASWAMRT